MGTISRTELRNNVGGVLRRAQAGEQITVTVAGRPVATLGPAERRQWITGRDLQRIWEMPAPRTLTEDLGRLPLSLDDAPA